MDKPNAVEPLLLATVPSKNAESIKARAAVSHLDAERLPVALHRERDRLLDPYRGMTNGIPGELAREEFRRKAQIRQVGQIRNGLDHLPCLPCSRR